MALRGGDRGRGRRGAEREGMEGKDVDFYAKWLPNCLNRKPIGSGGVEP